MPRTYSPTPKERAKFAAAALKAYRQKATFSSGEDLLTDLLTDLMHWSDEHEYEPDVYDFNTALKNAREHYVEEVNAYYPKVFVQKGNPDV